MDYQPVIIIGAPRSGTNMLRDVLCRLDGFGSWPCDEINMIWRYGNPGWPSDILPPDIANRPVCQFIRSQFDRQAAGSQSQFLVEKTCANSLRVPFVERVVEDAKYIFIHRDPVDCAVSAMNRWRAPFELAYTVKKVRFVPVSDVPYYAGQFVRNRVHRLFSGDSRVASWGPRYPDLDRDLDRYSLLEVCARQWTECVERAIEGFGQISDSRVHSLSYESFVAEPVTGLAGIVRFLGADVENDSLKQAVSPVTARSVGKGSQVLDENQIAGIQRIASGGIESVRGFSARSVSPTL